jgi:hypothetical protein
MNHVALSFVGTMLVENGIIVTQAEIQCHVR